MGHSRLGIALIGFALAGLVGLPSAATQSGGADGCAAARAELEKAQAAVAAAERAV